VALQIRTGQSQARPSSRAAVIAHFDRAIADLEVDGANVSLPVLLDGDATLPERYRAALETRLRELIEADRRTLEAQKAILTGANHTGDPVQADQVGKGSLTDLSAVWLSQKKPARSSQADMRTAIGRFDRVNGPLPYGAITDEHARRFKTDLLDDVKLKNATRAKLWGMLRALLNVAVDDGLLASNPFGRVKLRLDDDSSQREVLTQEDLTALFDKLDNAEEWWITRIALYTGARLGEICQLTKADFRTEAGVPYLHIREDAEAGKSVKTRSSIRRVPLHQQLIADGFREWAKGRTTDALFSVGSAAASKRLLRRMRGAGLGEGKVFHSLRHTFKGEARRHMDAEWHDRLTGHAAKSVGQDYGDYDLRSLKEKIDLIRFGVETPAARVVEVRQA
jgi:integrase